VRKSREKCYPAGNRKIFELAWHVLLALGVILLFASIPGWVIVALLGIALIAVGFILLKISQSWR
jgi:uncharacterized membrane protein